MLSSELDTPLQKGRRERLALELEKQQRFDKRIIRAIKAVPRHIFIDKGLQEFAYRDVPIAIDNEQTISQPSTVAMQTQLLDFKSGDRILEIGTGCGYQTAVLYYLGADVYSIERMKALYEKAVNNLKKLDYEKPHLFWGDGFKGMPQFAPYDGIIVTCGAPEIPESLLLQLKTGGKLVIPVDIKTDEREETVGIKKKRKKEQEMLVLTRKNETHFDKKSYGPAKFVPMLKDVQQ